VDTSFVLASKIGWWWSIYEPWYILYVDKIIRTSGGANPVITALTHQSQYHENKKTNELKIKIKIHSRTIVETDI